MTKKPTGKAVHDVKEHDGNAKPAPAATPGKKQVQIHAGNLGVVQTQLLGEINQNLATIAAVMTLWLKENPPKQEKANG